MLNRHNPTHLNFDSGSEFIFFVFVFVCAQGEEETPLTKSVRLTAALVLRNVAQYSSLAKR